MGLVKNYQGLLAARFFLGLTEAGLFPGVAYCIDVIGGILTCRYYPMVSSSRGAISYCSLLLSSDDSRGLQRDPCMGN